MSSIFISILFAVGGYMIGFLLGWISHAGIVKSRGKYLDDESEEL